MSKNLCKTCKNNLTTKDYDPNYTDGKGSHYSKRSKCIYWGTKMNAHECTLHNVREINITSLPPEDIDTDNFYKDGTPIEDFRDLSNPPEDGYKSGMEKAK